MRASLRFVDAMGAQRTHGRFERFFRRPRVLHGAQYRTVPDDQRRRSEMRTSRVVAMTGALAGLIAVVTSAQGPAVPKTPWGDPDLQGTFSSEAELSVPFERQAQYGDRRFLTDAEYAQPRTQAGKPLA